MEQIMNRLVSVSRHGEKLGRPILQKDRTDSRSPPSLKGLQFRQLVELILKRSRCMEICYQD